jgi:predicted GTPase
MKNEFEEIREQLHEIRNFLGPIEITISNLTAQVKRNKIEMEEKIAELTRRIESQNKEAAPAPPLHPTRAAPSETL